MVFFAANYLLGIGTDYSDSHCWVALKDPNATDEENFSCVYRLLTLSTDVGIYGENRKIRLFQSATPAHRAAVVFAVTFLFDSLLRTSQSFDDWSTPTVGNCSSKSQYSH